MYLTFTWIEVHYSNLIDLLRDIKGMGQSNALMQRNKLNPGKKFFVETEKIYKEMFLNEGKIRATFDIITMMGGK